MSRPLVFLVIGILLAGPAVGLAAYVHQAIEGPHDETNCPICHQISACSTAVQADAPPLIESPSTVAHRDVEREGFIPASRSCLHVIPRAPPLGA